MNLFLYDDIKISCKIVKFFLIIVFIVLVVYKFKKLWIVIKEYMVVCFVKDFFYRFLFY